MGTRVLIAVEDDEDMRFLVTAALSGDSRLSMTAGAANARDAVELARRVQPDLIILDHFIEGDIMGLQAAPLLKAAAPDAKILLFTTHDLAIEASREDAIDGFLRKDHLPQLLVTVQRMLGIEPDLVDA